jgi:hypothetical protein
MLCITPCECNVCLPIIWLHSASVLLTEYQLVKHVTNCNKKYLALQACTCMRPHTHTHIQQLVTTNTLSIRQLQLRQKCPKCCTAAQCSKCWMAYQYTCSYAVPFKFQTYADHEGIYFGTKRFKWLSNFLFMEIITWISFPTVSEFPLHYTVHNHSLL